MKLKELTLVELNKLRNQISLEMMLRLWPYLLAALLVFGCFNLWLWYLKKEIK